ncbi:hypothetical protein NQZ68_019032 [Dissostichus eleginoides]|nr:hypothetical protein NQZ68_019032 [Dissostichus eleginoides]
MLELDRLWFTAAPSLLTCSFVQLIQTRLITKPAMQPVLLPRTVQLSEGTEVHRHGLNTARFFLYTQLYGFTSFLFTSLVSYQEIPLFEILPQPESL